MSEQHGQEDMQQAFAKDIEEAGRETSPSSMERFEDAELAHRGVLNFLGEVCRRAEPILRAYNEAARDAALPTRTSWKLLPGQFTGAVSEYDVQGGVPWLILQDTVTGRDICGTGFMRFSPGDLGWTREHGNTGYQMAGTGFIISSSETEPDEAHEEALRQVLRSTRNNLGRYLRSRGYR